MRHLLAILLLTTSANAADWKPVEKVETYKIIGETGFELYESIGQNGPETSIGRAIAYTNFDLKWSRDYVPSDGGCTLEKARPHLIIIFKLPKPAKKLPAATQALWDTFAAGIRRHEQVHADIIVDMVNAIEAFSVGLRVEDDPKCQKIRKVLTGRLSELSQAQRARSRDFDRDELSEGGNVHKLVLALVNGG